jgi:DNA ligase-1
MSEKLDGVRCYWDGNKLYTRNGNETFAPPEWIAKLPSTPLDGELWSGRDQF